MTLESGILVPYYLDEESNWRMPVEDLQDVIQEARESGTVIRSMCVINPGNPTGQVLKKDSLEEVIKICHANNIMILADEVY